MNTLLTTMLHGLLLTSVVVLLLVVSSSETRKLRTLLLFSAMNLLLILLLLGIWYNMSYFMSISRGQEVMLRSPGSTGTVLLSQQKSQTWPLTAKLWI